MEKRPDILLVDDDRELGDLLRDYLGKQGYALEVATGGNAGLERARAGGHALVLLDIMLPEMDGVEVLKTLRRTANVPVIMLTARGDEVDRIVGLELGADDYLPKPFSPRELVARIKAVLRRAPGASTPGAAGTAAAGPRARLRLGGLEIDPEAFRASLDGADLQLTAIEFTLLRALAEAPGRVMTRDTLLDRVRGREFEAFDRSIDVHISRLRQKLGDDPRRPQFIRTVRTVGYAFVEPAPAEVAAAAPAPPARRATGSPTARKGRG